MRLGQVVGTAVATIKAPGLEGVKLLVVQPVDRNRAPQGNLRVAADAGQAGPGDMVFMVRAREAALALEESFVPVDLAILGIIDRLDVDSSLQNFALGRGYTKFT